MTVLSRRNLILAAAGGSAVVLLGAFGFQHLGDMPPCKLCLWQRWPHAAAIVLAVPALLTHARLWPYLGALAAVATAVIGGYHTGVERKWWEGPSSCTGTDISGLSTDDLMAQIMAAPVIRCDEVPWEMFGLSMATYNMLGSLVLAALWLWAARRT